MKKTIFLLLLVPAMISSCVQSMSEIESTKIAGTWAVVDENDMTSRFFIFDMGYAYEYHSRNSYFVCDNVLWGAEPLEDAYADKHKYSLNDGILHYYNHYNEVTTSLRVENGLMTMGNDRCVPVKDVNESYYSTIDLSKKNKRNFLSKDEDVEWEYDIDNPVEGFKLTVAEAPVWCGGVEGVRVDDERICFSVVASSETLEGRFVFKYASAQDVEVEVGMKAPEIVLDKTSASLRYPAARYSFTYEIQNKVEGIQPTIECDADWVTEISDDGGTITYAVDANVSGAVRNGQITLTYCGVSAEYKLTQSYARTEIVLEETSTVLVYKAASCMFNYAIEDRLEDAELMMQSDVEWITDIQDDGGAITYSVAANNSGSSRSGKIVLRYFDHTAEYTVTQSYSRGYAFWVGEWTFTGANGIVQKVKFSPGVADVSFLMTGLYGLTDDVPITVNWDEVNQTWDISNQNLGKCTIPTGRTGGAWLYGEDENGSYIPVSRIPICTGGISNDGNLVVTPYDGQLQEPYNRHFKVNTMFVMVYEESGNQIGILPDKYSDRLTFPIAIR